MKASGKDIDFSHKISYSECMRYTLLLLGLPLFLTGCIGSWIGGHTSSIDKCYPDIRTVPERPEACKDRCLHDKQEDKARAEDLKCLEEDRAKIQARNEALREKAFANPEAE